jgi:imidazolonepropionase-like amidohydrolase
MLKKIIFFFFIILISCTNNEKYNDSEYTVLENITIIDGKGNQPLENMFIVLKDSLIVDIASMENKNYGQKVNKLNLNGNYVIPGLIDMHAHVTVLPLTKDGYLAHNIDTSVSIVSLQTLLNFGITTVRNPAGPEDDAVWLREQVKLGHIIGPRIYTSGRALNRNSSSPFVKVNTDEEIQNAIAKQISVGVDFIKVYGGLKPEQTQKAIEYAHSKNLKVIGHLQNTSWTDAAKDNIDFITHAFSWAPEYLPEKFRHKYSPTILGRLYWLDNIDLEMGTIPEMIKLVKEKNISIDPTLIALHTKFWGNDSIYLYSPYNSFVDSTILDIWKKYTFVDDWKSKDFDKAKKLWPKVLKYIKLIYDNGILLTTGSDFPNPWVVPGISLYQEMKLLNDCGITPLEVIKIATYNGAQALGLDKKLGSIEKNKIADLVVLSKNPIDNILNINSVRMVFKNGNKIN